MDIIELIKAAIIGIIEGITEWLPISSTGHMIIADEFIKLNVSPEFWEMFLVVIQLGAIMAVIVLYFNKLNPFAPSKGKEGRRKTWVLWAKVIVACIPAAIIGILLDDWFEEHFHNAITVAIALIVYGIAFIIIERVKGPENPDSHKALAAGDRQRGDNRKRSADKQAGGKRVGKHSAEALAAKGASSSSALQEALPRTSTRGAVSDKNAANNTDVATRRKSKDAKPGKAGKGGNAVSDVDELGFGRALGIGVFQCLAIVPGTSRSGSTILGGRILGVSRAAAAEFSFFLAIPVMFGWSLLKVVKGFILDGLVLTSTEWGVFAVGIVVAFIVSILAIKFLMSFIRNHSFEVFGWYRIVLGIVVLAFFAISGQLFIMQ